MIFMERKKTFVQFVSLVILVYVFYYIVFQHGIPCIFHTLTGFYCPGCGITRMFLSLISFDFYQAFRFNPVVFLLVLITPFYFLFTTFYLKKTGKKWILPNAIYIILLVILIVFGFLRNLEFFSYLAPTIVK